MIAARSSGQTLRGIPYADAPRSAPAASTATPRDSPSDSVASPTIHSNRGSTSGSCLRNSDQPLRWRAARRIFVNSMSDLFHDRVPTEYISRVGRVMAEAKWHTFQVLTKRHERLQSLLNGELAWMGSLSNVWWGVSVEDREHGLPRIDSLRKTNARVRFLSVEPLLEDLGEFNLSGIDWVIVGGESGPHFRTMAAAWAERIRDRCLEARVPFFFKQWGGRSPKHLGRKLDGREWNGMPKVFDSDPHPPCAAS